jgi:hypothetical protein
MQAHSMQVHDASDATIQNGSCVEMKMLPPINSQLRSATVGMETDTHRPLKEYRSRGAAATQHPADPGPKPP